MAEHTDQDKGGKGEGFAFKPPPAATGIVHRNLTVRPLRAVVGFVCVIRIFGLHTQHVSNKIMSHLEIGVDAGVALQLCMVFYTYVLPCNQIL